MARAASTDPGVSSVKSSQVIAYLDTSGGLDLDARRPWPGRRQADEVTRPLDARALLGASSAPGLWDVATLAPTVLAPLADAAAADPRPVRWDVDAWYRPAHLAAYDMGIVVRPEGLDEYDSELKKVTVPFYATHLAAVGRELPAWVDPGRLDKVVIDWASASEADPGTGVPPAEIVVIGAGVVGTYNNRLVIDYSNIQMASGGRAPDRYPFETLPGWGQTLIENRINVQYQFYF